VGKDGTALLAAGFGLMFVAAPIEGFFSFSPSVPMEAKVIVGVVELIAFTAFWLTYGRDPESRADK
jgi:Zn-dependent protease with chaperone function